MTEPLLDALRETARMVAHDAAAAATKKLATRLLHRLKYLSNATVHVDPVGLAGEEHHRHGLGNTEHVDDHEEANGHAGGHADDGGHDQGHSHA